jgi:hypothetical protein
MGDRHPWTTGHAPSLLERRELQILKVAGATHHYLHFPGTFRLDGMVGDLSLELRTYERALLTPLRTGRRGAHLVGAMYTEHRRLILDSERSKNNRAWWGNLSWLPPEDLGEPEFLEGRTFYGGPLLELFGHVVTELLTRLWPDVDYAAYDNILVSPARPDEEGGLRRLDLRPYTREFLTARGIDPDRVLTSGRRPVRIESVDVATSSFFDRRVADPAGLVAFDLIGDVLEARDHGARPERIFLSRSRLTNNVRAADNETQIDAFMADRGFTVVYPEELPLARQIALIRGAKIIAGCDGSALHLALFGRPGQRLLAIDSRYVANQSLVDQVRQLESYHVLAADRERPNRAGRWFADMNYLAEAVDLATEGL